MESGRSQVQASSVWRHLAEDGDRDGERPELVLRVANAQRDGAGEAGTEVGSTQRNGGGAEPTRSVANAQQDGDGPRADTARCERPARRDGPEADTARRERPARRGRADLALRVENPQQDGPEPILRVGSTQRDG